MNEDWELQVWPERVMQSRNSIDGRREVLIK